MKRGIFFLAVGFGLGYVKAVSDHEDIRAAALTFQYFLLNFEEEQREATAKQKAREAARKAREEVPEEEVVVEDAVTVPNDAESEQQGETP